MRQSSVGSRSDHTDNPQGSRRAVASKTAPSQPKHDGAESQRGPRHVSSCRLIPACAKKKKRGLRRHKEPRCPVSTSDVIHRRRPKKQQQGRWKEGQRSPQECHRHVCYRIFSSEAATGAFSTSENSLSGIALTLPCEIIRPANRCNPPLMT